MAHSPLSTVVSALLLGAAFSDLALPAASGLDRRPTGPTSSPPPRPQPQPERRPQEPCRRRAPPYCPPPPVPAKPDRSYEITILSVDAGRAAVPAVSAFLAGTSNPKEQLVGLQAQAKRGLVVLQVSSGPTLRVPQDATGTRDVDEARSRVTAHPHLNAGCAEAIDFLVEQAPQGAVQTGTGTRISLVFENGDTRLLSETARPDGSRHLLYATVFFPPVPCPR